MDDVQHVEQLPFVLVNALDMDIEKRIAIENLTQRFFDEVRQALLVVALDRPEAFAETARSPASGSRPRSWSRSVIQLLPSDSVMSSASGGLAASSQRAGRDAVGLAVESIRPEFVEIGDQLRLDQLAVHLRRRH